jgi:pyruvate dehydrogenase E2 component (dihydrolipoamide acetyltransferase)
MANVIMPKMGDGMEEGTLLRWLKQVGDQVDIGDPIAEIETDKVSLEIEAAEGGVFTKMLVEEGQAVPIGTPIASIGAEGEAAEAAEATPEEATAAPATAQAEAPAAPKAEEAATAVEAEPVAARATAPEPAAATTSAPPPATTNGLADATAVAREPGDRMRASPIVKRLAAEHGIDLAAIAGSGPGGRIVKDDIMPYVTGAKPAPAVGEPLAAPADQAAAPAQPVAAPAVGAPLAAPAGVAREMPRIRKVTGKRMFESKSTIPHFYVSSVVEMDAAAAFREQINAQATDDSSKVSFNDLIVKAAALVLRQFPNLNTSLESETLYDHANIDINVAVAIEGGLIAPFVRDADSKSLGAIARTTKDVINRARNGGLEPAEYQGGTFTISNLGMFDVDEFIAIINPPQAAILAVGSITDTPVVKDGRISAGKRMKISLSADHRITDGAEVARFLMAVKGYLQNPLQLALS